jgi:histidinol-phosphate aminotransferase
VDPNFTALRLHGGIQAEEISHIELGAPEILDFSVNVSPLGPPSGVRAALDRLDLARYPDPRSTTLRRAVAEQLGVGPDEILIGNGSTELIHLVVRLFVRRGQRPVVFAPTFSEFERAAELAGAHPYPWIARPERQFRWPLGNKPGVLERVRPPLVWLCNPNNPTGVYLGRAQVQRIAAALSGGPLLLDEAYVNFVFEPWSSLDLTRDRRVIVLRSMTKDYALAGLRLGYLVAHPELVQAAAVLQPEWSVNAAAQAAGLAALSDGGYLERMRRAVAEAKEYLVSAVRALGLPVNEGTANFVLVQVGDASSVRTRLLQLGLSVRDCSSFGLPGYIRIGVRPLPDCRRLVEALQALYPTQQTGQER